MFHRLYLYVEYSVDITCVDSVLCGKAIECAGVSFDKAVATRRFAFAKIYAKIALFNEAGNAGPGCHTLDIISIYFTFPAGEFQNRPANFIRDGKRGGVCFGFHVGRAAVFDDIVKKRDFLFQVAATGTANFFSDGMAVRYKRIGIGVIETGARFTKENIVNFAVHCSSQNSGQDCRGRFMSWGRGSYLSFRDSARHFLKDGCDNIARQ